MKSDLLKEIIGKIKSVRIGVIGDFCLDAYWFIDGSKCEISIETGKMTRPVRQQNYSLGGAGNVANNLAAMGIKDVRAFGVIGTDPFGEAMTGLMKKAGINTSDILVQREDWSTHVYTKPYIGDEEESRIDFGNFNVLSEETADRLISNLKKETGELDLIIINQQVLSGIHTMYFRKRLVEVIRLFPGKIFIADSRNYNDFYDGAYRKMNDDEALRLCGIEGLSGSTASYDDIRQAAESLYDRYNKPVFVTRGDRGSMIAGRSGVTDIPGLMIVSRIDTVGAGDSYLAGAAAVMAAGFGTIEAAETGTLVAGVTIQKLFQTGTASAEEILTIGEDPDFIYNPELAENIRYAAYSGGTDIEIINKWKDGHRIRHAIFDHDGTVSTLREGWESIMAPMMIRAVLGEKYNVSDKQLFNRVETQVNDLIDKTTGVQTLLQMKKLSGLVRDFGFVPGKDILDEHGYKAIYNDAILKHVNLRRKKIAAGELDREDFVIKNVIHFLEALKGAGIKLYLASGTDVAEVIDEAEFLGYAGLFDGGIHGAVGDVNHEAKKFVLNNILMEIGDSESGQIAAFGDGPVEIRETRKKGGITIGVASNEIRRFGLNERKRTRLIKAGADIIIPDFTCLPVLLKLLNI